MTPYGKALADYYRKPMQQMLTVYSDIADPDTLPVSYFFRPYSEMPVLEQKALALCKGKVLDVGAGAGIHADYLSAKGFDVSVLEQDEQAFNVLKLKGHKGFNQRFLGLEPTVSFDTLLMLMNGIGIAGSLDNLPNFFAHCFELLADGGQLIIDSSDISYMYEKIENTSDYYGEVMYAFEYEGVKGDMFSWLFLDQKKMIQFAEKAGFNVSIAAKGDHYDYLAVLTKN